MHSLSPTMNAAIASAGRVRAAAPTLPPCSPQLAGWQRRRERNPNPSTLPPRCPWLGLVQPRLMVLPVAPVRPAAVSEGSDNWG